MHSPHNLKIEYDHFCILQSAIRQAEKEFLETLDSYQQRKLTPKRWRWDLLWYATAKILPKHWICDTLYPYMNDTHIDNALRFITNTK